ncbi:unnamed protein product [Chrysodeixis includens]|uniref:Uncharacterized protein n=1 Tax=Chrysodeixis includens TaxID=689277 RepID=A0A9N8Q2J5_CHRIL|nr:unnamed protein product [Chrysodeixis includens]
MEGDVEGLVAIVQGLDDAGVTLTVLNRGRERAPRRQQRQRRLQLNQMPTSDRGSPGPEHPRKETSPEVKTTSTGVQICDGRYASSYRVLNSVLFPDQGNFEVGGHGSCQFRPASAHCRASGSLNWGERPPGSNQASVDAFITPCASTEAYHPSTLCLRTDQKNHHCLRQEPGTSCSYADRVRGSDVEAPPGPSPSLLGRDRHWTTRVATKTVNHGTYG